MTPRRRQICKPLARGSHCALARKCLRDNKVKKFITKGFGTLLHNDIASLCSDNGGIRKNLTSLQWTNLLSLIKTKAPTLLSILQKCTKTKSERLNQNTIIGVLTSILCKHRRSSASLFQQVVSLILYSGHA